MTLLAQAANAANAIDLSGLLNTQSLLMLVGGFGLAVLKARFPNLPLPSPLPGPPAVPSPVVPEPAGVVVSKLSDAAVEQIRAVVEEGK